MAVVGIEFVYFFLVFFNVCCVGFFVFGVLVEIVEFVIGDINVGGV